VPIDRTVADAERMSHVDDGRLAAKDLLRGFEDLLGRERPFGHPATPPGSLSRDAIWAAW
jgi:hypothetical protein